MPTFVASDPEIATPPEALPNEVTGDAVTCGISTIGSTVVMRGELTLDEDLIFDGKFDGTLIDGARMLSIGLFAEVNADIVGESADIAGSIDGQFKGSGTVYVRRTARISGAISAQDLRVEDGTNLEHVVLSGRISRAEEPEPRKRKRP